MNQINSEADRLFKALFEYADEMRDRNVYDITDVFDGFYKKLSSDYDDSGKNSLTKRVLNLMKHYVETDPRIQLRMDQF